MQSRYRPTYFARVLFKRSISPCRCEFIHAESQTSRTTAATKRDRLPKRNDARPGPTGSGLPRYVESSCGYGYDCSANTCARRCSTRGWRYARPDDTRENSGNGSPSSIGCAGGGAVRPLAFVRPPSPRYSPSGSALGRPPPGPRALTRSRRATAAHRSRSRAQTHAETKARPTRGN